MFFWQSLCVRWITSARIHEKLCLATLTRFSHYSEPPTYGHPINTDTSLLQPLHSGLNNSSVSQSFSYLKNPSIEPTHQYGQIFLAHWWRNYQGSTVVVNPVFFCPIAWMTKSFLKGCFIGQVLGRGEMKLQYDQNELESYLHHFNKYFGGNLTFLLIDIGIKECAH